MSKRRSGRSRRGRTRRYLRRLGLALCLVGVVVGTAVGILVYRELQRSLPPITAAVDYQPPVATQVFADDGTLIAEFYAEKRYLVPLQRVPNVVRQAFIAAEDSAFYRHRGIDPTGIARAFFKNLSVGGTVQGGSTITQQVVKSLLLTPERSYERKIKEILLALKLERQLSKDEILHLYLNHIYLGSGAYGVAAAAREYFGKDISDVNLPQAALLAGLPQAPSRYSPFRHWRRAKARQRYVLERMLQNGFIDSGQHDAALREPLALARRKGSFIEAPYFVEHIRRTLEELYGKTAFRDAGLRVYTTLNVAMQRAAEATLRHGLEALSARHHAYRGAFRDMGPDAREAYLKETRRLLNGAKLEEFRGYEGIITSVRSGGARVQVGQFSGDLVPDPTVGTALPALELNDLVRVRLVDEDQNGLQFVLDSSPPVEGALISLQPDTGYVRAMVGGYDFERSQFNRATQARRQPGSAFKPLVYAAALDRGLTPATVIVDEPIYFNDHGKIWGPQNFEKEFFGPTLLRTALVKSRNVVTVKVADRIGIGYLVHYLSRFGFARPLPRNLSIALGSSEVTPLALAAAYATLANAGQRPKPIFITEITGPRGNVLETNSPQLTQAIPPQTAYLVTNMMQDVVRRGTGRNARGLGRPTAGKTGTTNDQEDAWFVGFTPNLLTAVWVGFDTKRTLGHWETGGRVAAPIWKSFMQKATSGLPRREFPVPDGIKCVNIDPETGQRAIPGGGAVFECFREGTEPQLGTAPAIRETEVEGPPAPSDRDFLLNDF